LKGERPHRFRSAGDLCTREGRPVLGMLTDRDIVTAVFARTSASQPWLNAATV